MESPQIKRILFVWVDPKSAKLDDIFKNFYATKKRSYNVYHYIYANNKRLDVISSMKIVGDSILLHKC